MEAQMKKIVKRTLIAIVVIFAVLAAAIYIVWGNEIKSLLSIEQKIAQDMVHGDGYTYEMTISGDYYFDEFLEQGGATSDQELISFVTEKITKGLIPMTIEESEIACSSFTARTEDGDYLLGRNYDFDQTNTAIVHTNPGNGKHASISTIDLQFIGIDPKKGVNGISDKIKLLAAPYVPLDGVNDAGVSCGIYMTYQGKETVPTDQNTERPDLTSTTMLRMVLDYADNVDEAIEMIAKYDLHDSAKTSYHYMIADAEGNSAVLEWVNGTDQTDNDGSKRELQITRNELPYQSVTNFILAPGYYEANDEQAGLDRYEYLMGKLNASNGVLEDEEEAMGLLRDVGRRTWKVEGDVTKGTTVHSVVYNLKDRSSLWVANEHFGSEEHTLTYELGE